MSTNKPTDPAPLDAAEIRERHRRAIRGRPWCACCHLDWPCEPIRLLDALDALRTENERQADTLAERFLALRNVQAALEERTALHEQADAEAAVWKRQHYERTAELEAARAEVVRLRGLLNEWLSLVQSGALMLRDGISRTWPDRVAAETEYARAEADGGE